jgi:hypothetical protein
MRAKRWEGRWPYVHDIKAKARKKLHYAIRKGLVAKAAHCEMCPEPKVQAHHPDYSKPLDVRWLCTKHHRQADLALKTA